MHTRVKFGVGQRFTLAVFVDINQLGGVGGTFGVLRKQLTDIFFCF